MRIGIIGSGIVAELLARVIPQHIDVTIFSDGGTFSPKKLANTNSKTRVIANKWSFPKFNCIGGSSPYWGGVLAIPNIVTLKSYGIKNITPQELLDICRTDFSFEEVYGLEFGFLEYLIKANPSMIESKHSRDRILERVLSLEDKNGKVSISTGTDQIYDGFDYCFIASGASTIPQIDKGGVIRLVEPNIIWDKLITIEPRSLEQADCSQYVEVGSDLIKLSVPITLPCEVTDKNITAIFRHILSVNSIVPLWTHAAYRGLSFFEYMKFAMGMVSGKAVPAWFSTYCGSRDYLVHYKDESTRVVQKYEDKLLGSVFMPALHGDARLPNNVQLGANIFSEHLQENDAPIPFNPVVLRFAKLYEQLKRIL